MSKSRDVIVIGAGAIGCSIAYHLGRRGISARVVDRESIAARASGKAWAVFTYAPSWIASEHCITQLSATREGAPVDIYATVPGVSVGDWLFLHASSYDRMPELAIELEERGGVDIEYCETPSTSLVTAEELEEAGGPEALLRPGRAAGDVEADWIDGDALREFFPSLNPVYVGGISHPAGQVEPYRFSLAMAQAAEKLGAEFVQGEVVDFSTQGETITGVQLASGKELQAAAVVLATGPWIGKLSGKLDSPIACRPVFSECLRAKLPVDLPLHTLYAGEISILPKKNGEVILATYGAKDFVDRSDFDASLSEETKLATLEGVVRVLPELESARIVEHRGDLLAMAPTPPYQKPVMGRFPDWRNAYVAARFGGDGVCMSPAAGELIAELIDTGQVPLRARHMFECLAPASAGR
ncbi:MAG: FAD-binding oxidoreductase [Deltaproteobacteria bacterium]|nr:FAD-binding oxidoreductase [Deltaproteobacteria bacterium]